MFKTIVAGTVALMIAGAGLAFAQQTPPRDAPRWRPSAEDIQALTDARIAGLKAGLKLSAEQEKHWPAVEAAIRDLAKQRADRMNEPRDLQRPFHAATGPNGHRGLMSTRPSTTLADLLTPPLGANPFSTMRATLQW
jgi:hypothetical protein